MGQQLQTADRRKAIPRDRDAGIVVNNCYIVPRFHVRSKNVMEFLVVGTEEFKRTIGEHDSEAPSGVARTALKDGDVMGWVAPFHQGGEVQAGGAGSQDLDLHTIPLRSENRQHM